MKLTRNMTEGNLYKALLVFAVPLAFSMMLSQAYSTIDGVIAGKLISENALGAISATSSYELLLHALFSGFASGFGIYIAQQFGKGDFGAVKQDVLSMGIFITAAAATISLITILLRAPILDYLKVDPVLRGDAETYFVIFTMGYAFVYLNLMLAQVLYALGVTSVSLLVSFLSAAVKIGGNLLSVLVLDWGVAGLAFFTVVSGAATTVCYLLILRKAFRELKSEKTPFRFRFSCIKASLRYTLPAAVQQAAFHGVGWLIAPSVNGLGAAATTANNVSNRIYNIATVPLWAVTNAFNSYTAQCVGKGDCKKIGRGVKAAFILNSLALLPAVAGIMGFARPVVSIFFPEDFAGAAFDYSVRYATVWLPFVFVQLVGHILHSYMRSLGRVNTVLWITLLVSAVRVAATVFLTPVLHIEGAFLGQVISWAVDGVVSVMIVVCLYRTQAQLQRIVEKVHRRKREI